MVRRWTGAKVGLVVTVGFGLACGSGGPREAGPHSYEYGDVLFWDVVDDDVELADCPDDGSLDSYLDLSPFNVGGVFAYELSQSGERAYLLDCTDYDSDACTKVPGPAMDVDGHEMSVLMGIDAVGQLGDCTYTVTEALTFVDGGEDGRLEQVIRHNFDGDEADCAAYSAEFADAEGVGLADCTIVFGADLTYADRDRF